MPTRYYKLTVILCALSWFLVGLHLPVLHQMTHHGQAPRWDVLLLLALFAVMAVGELWVLLRAPAPWARPSGDGPATR